MNYFRLIIISLFVLVCRSATASTLSNDRNFNQESMIMTPYSIMVLTPTSDVDYLTAYQENGTFLWTTAFKTKVLSWSIKPENGFLYVFSQSRYLESTKLTCIDPVTGYVVWEKP